MVNYRHRHHAGSVHDLVKHLALVTLLRRLNARVSPWFYLDTHAGEGWYESVSQEAETGFFRLLDHAHDICHPLLKFYLKRVEIAVSASRHYASSAIIPGSPVLAASLARATDRLVLVDNTVRPRLDLPGLQVAAKVQTHQRDGWEALRAFLPPHEGRGLVLIDPPYEALDETRRLTQALARALERFPHGRYLVWYPLSRRARIPRLPRHVIPGDILYIDVLWAPREDVRGTGLLIIHPSEDCQTDLPKALEELLAHLDLRGEIRIRSSAPREIDQETASGESG